MATRANHDTAVPEPAEPLAGRLTPVDSPRGVRERHGIGAKLFARVMAVTPDALAQWEAAGEARPTDLQRLALVADLLDRLARLLPSGYLPAWLEKPNRASRTFGVNAPVHLFEQGRYEPVETMIYRMGSGDPV